MRPPACKTCTGRRGYIYEGPTRVICPGCDGSGNRPATAIAKEGERGAEKREARKEARALYFELHNTAGPDSSLKKAPCQFCGDRMVEKVTAVDAAHKERRWKGDDSPENMCAVEHSCHEWQGQNSAAEAFLLTSPVNVVTGGVVQWPQYLVESLRKWKLRTP